MSKIKREELDIYSQQFIAWVESVMGDQQQYIDLLRELPRKAANFYSRNPDEIRSRLIAKLEAGAKEHGEPFHEEEWMLKELENEYLDMIGYALLITWNRDNKKS